MECLCKKRPERPFALPSHVFDLALVVPLLRLNQSLLVKTICRADIAYNFL